MICSDLSTSGGRRRTEPHRLRHGLTTLVCALPPSRLKNQALRGLGHKVDPRARIGCVLAIRVNEISVGKNSSIGHLNVFRDLSSLVLGESATVGQWNWISASAPLVASGAPGLLAMKRHSALTSRHYLDASGGIHIGAYTTVAGVRTTIVTHGIDWGEGAQRTSPVTIGDYCMIGSNAIVTPGCTVGDQIVTGMGACLVGEVTESGALYVSDRASVVRRGLKGKYFERETGFVGVGNP